MYCCRCWVFRPANGCSVCCLLVKINFLMLKQFFPSISVIKCFKNAKNNFFLMFALLKRTSFLFTFYGLYFGHHLQDLLLTKTRTRGRGRQKIQICSKKWFAKNNYGQTGRAYFMDLSLLYSIVRPFSGRNTQHIDVCVLFFYFMDISNCGRCTTSTYGWVLELRLFLLRNLKSLKRTPQNSKISH